jgi:16S rRNA (guanine966-N2)-methyltransferase
MTRITGGTWKGRRIHTLPGLATRPTSAMAKEALFSVLGARVAGASVLDLFAGTGGVAWEALSRGAAQAALVEKSGGAARVLRANRDLLGADAKIYQTDTFAFLARAAGRERFDFIFLDPPYRQKLARQTLDLLKTISLLQYKGVVVAETETEETLDSCPPLELRDVKRYGGAKLWFFQENV